MLAKEQAGSKNSAGPTLQATTMLSVPATQGFTQVSTEGKATHNESGRQGQFLLQCRHELSAND
jgi:hypothetical protein